MIKALNEYVFLSYEKEKEAKKKGVVISNVSGKKSEMARVMFVGDGVKGVKKGATVIFDPHLPREVKVDNKTYMILKEKDLFGIVTEQ